MTGKPGLLRESGKRMDGRGPETARSYIRRAPDPSTPLGYRDAASAGPFFPNPRGNPNGYTCPRRPGHHALTRRSTYLAAGMPMPSARPGFCNSPDARRRRRPPVRLAGLLLMLAAVAALIALPQAPPVLAAAGDATGQPSIERLVRFKEESDLPRAELNRRLGAHPQTMRRWKQGLSWLGGNRLD